MTVSAIDTPTEHERWLERYRYVWPENGSASGAKWQAAPGGRSLVRELPETAPELAADSRWPAFFPSSICFVTATVGGVPVMEKVVGASIVNRFPYIVALSFCRDELSSRHHARRQFMEAVETSAAVAIQFLPQGPLLDRAMSAVTSTTDAATTTRISDAGLPTTRALTSEAPVFTDAYLVYEACLARRAQDREGHAIYTQPWADVGSHRVYFFEITAIQLREDIARGHSQIHWRSLPAWAPERPLQDHPPSPGSDRVYSGYQKPYTPHYAFPAPHTIAFEADYIRHGMAVKFLSPLADDQIEVDNDRARWPCFFPSSVGMITTWGDNGTPNLMPCGSTTILSRHPLIVAPCVSYSAINERYAPRATLELLRRNGRFVCGVPFIHDTVLEGIRYAGNISLARNAEKVSHAGLEVEPGEFGPLLPALPVQFECDVVGEIRLGTHIMFLGEVKRIRLRSDLKSDNPLQWCPWPVVETAPGGDTRGPAAESSAHVSRSHE